MTHKQVLGVAAGGVIIVAAFVSVYRQFAKPAPVSQMPATQSVTATKQSVATDTQVVKSAEVPSSIDAISQSITDESSADQSALNDEVTGEEFDMQADNQSVNDLGQTYDENSL